MSEHARRDRGALESEVLAAMGAVGSAMTPRQVQAALGADLAYTTVMTTLARLHDKGALTRCRDGKAYAYSLAGDAAGVRAALTARGMRRLLDGGGDRSVTLARFVDELSTDDERTLVRLVRHLDPDHGAVHD